MTFSVKIPVDHPVRFLRAECGVRYWEDATINETADDDGSLIPLRSGDSWCPTIDLDTGIIVGWPAGVTADIHYKVCDDGRYALLDADANVVCQIDGYVPAMMSPGGSGYGDYVMMSIGPDGLIENWDVDLSEFNASLIEGARR